MAERKIKHGLFRYYVPTETVDAAGKEVTMLQEMFAYHNETVDIPRKADVDKGDAAGAFWTDEELSKLKSARSTGAPETVVNGTIVRNSEGEEVDLTEVDNEELDEWLMSVGQFDDMKKPSVDTVVAVGGQDPNLAERLIDAEGRSRPGQERKGVVDQLGQIVASRNA